MIKPAKFPAWIDYESVAEQLLAAVAVRAERLIFP